jgi:aquaporin Z
MILAAELYARMKSLSRVYCGKLLHHNNKRCISRCNYAALAASDDILPR